MSGSSEANCWGLALSEVCGDDISSDSDLGLHVPKVDSLGDGTLHLMVLVVHVMLLLLLIRALVRD